MVVFKKGERRGLCREGSVKNHSKETTNVSKNDCRFIYEKCKSSIFQYYLSRKNAAWGITMIEKIWGFLKKKGLKILWIAYVSISVILTIRFADRLLVKDYESISKCLFLDKHWNIIYHDTFHQNVSLGDFVFDKVKTGDRIVMQRALPDDWEMKEGMLRLGIRHTAVKMYIGDSLVYEYGFDRAEKNKTVGSGYLFIDFPDHYKGKKMKLELCASENEAFTQIDNLRIYEWKNAYRALLTENRIPMFVGVFLLIFGLSTLIITMFAMLVSRKYARIFCISSFSVCMGLWTLCNYDILLVFSIPLYSKSLIEYLALYLLPVPLLVYMDGNVKNLDNKVLKIVFKVLFAVQLIFDFVIIGLHTKDIVHCAAALPYQQALIVCHLVLFTVIVILNLKTKNFLNRLYLVGMLIMLGCVGYDLYGYYMERYNGNFSVGIKGISALGMMVFIFILIIEFYMELSYKMMQEAERNSLIKSAYTDELTQLHNRRYCSEHMQQINEDQTAEYTVVCFDLNNLKVVNDTLGHAQGDMLIKSAAEVIETSFGRLGVVGRMGGDEFIAILKNTSKGGMDAVIRQFQENIKKKNQEVKGLNLAIAYGYASSFETGEKGVEKLYQEADDRMYENKQQYKKEHPYARGRQ